MQVGCSTPEAFRLMMEGSRAFALMENQGIRIDEDYIDRTIYDVSAKISELESDLKQDPIYDLWRRRFGIKASISNRNQLGAVVFEELGIEPTKMTKQQRASTEEEAFEEIDLPFVKRWNEIDKLRRLMSTNLLGIKKELCNGVLRPSFNLHTVITFRSSCSDPNGQNIPNRNDAIARLVRRAFIPTSDEYVLIESDFSGIEVRAATCYHHDPTMIQYLIDDYDMHKDMAAECYKIPSHLVSKKIRGVAKNRFVFASFYGDWYFSICQMLWKAVVLDKLELSDGMPLRDHLDRVGLSDLGDVRMEGNRVIPPRPGTFEAHIKEVENRFWNERFAVYTQWKKEWWEAYLKTGWYRMKTGFVSKGVFDKNKVINGPIQGTAFHWLLWTLIELDKWLRRKKFKTRIIGQIHDSILMNCYRKELQDVLTKLESLITQGLRRHWDWIIVPLATESSVCELNWYEKVEWVNRNGTWAPK